MANWIECEGGDWINTELVATVKFVSAKQNGRWRVHFYDEKGGLAGALEEVNKLDLREALGGVLDPLAPKAQA
jgi:hypothetical protein